MTEQTAAEKAKALLEAMKAKKAAAQAAPVTAQAPADPLNVSGSPLSVLGGATQNPEHATPDTGHRTRGTGPAAPSPAPFLDTETTVVTEPEGSLPPMPARLVTPPPKTPDNTADLEDPDINEAFDGAMPLRARALRDAAMAHELGLSSVRAVDKTPAEPTDQEAEAAPELDVPEDDIVEEEDMEETPHASPFAQASEDDFSDVAADSDERIDLGLLGADDSVDEALRAAIPKRAERSTGPIEVGIPDALLAPESAAADAIAEAVDQVDDSRAFSFDGESHVVKIEEEPEAPVQSSNILPILAKARAGTLLDAEEALHALRVLAVGRSTAQHIRDSPEEVDTSMGTNAAALLANESFFLPNVRTILFQSPESVLRQIEADTAETWSPIRETVRAVAEERGITLSPAPELAPHAPLGTPNRASTTDSGSLASQLVSALPVLAPRPRDGATSAGTLARTISSDSVPGRMAGNVVDSRPHPEPVAPRAPRVSSPAPSVSGSGDGLTPAARVALDELGKEAALRNSANAAAHRADVAANHPANHDAGRDHARAEMLRAVAATGGRGPATPAPEEPEYVAPSISAYSVDSFLQAVHNNQNPRGSNNSTRYEREVYHQFSQYTRVVADVQKSSDARPQWQRIESAATVYWTTFYRNELVECTSLEAVRDHGPSSPNPAKLKAFEAARRDLFMQVVLETSDRLSRASDAVHASTLDTLRTTWGQNVVDLLVITTSDLAGEKPAWLSLALERASEDVRARIGPTLTPLDRTPTPWTVEMVFDQITRNPHAPGSEDFARYDSELYETVTHDAPGIVPQVQNHLRGVLWGRLEVAHAMWTLENGPTTATVAPTAEMLAAGTVAPATTPEEAIARGRSRNIDSNWTIEGYREAVRSINRLPEDMLARGHVLLYDTIVAESPGVIETLETNSNTRVLWKVTTSTYERDGSSVLAGIMNSMGSNEERVAFFISRFMGTILQRDSVNRVPEICDADWMEGFNARVGEELHRALAQQHEPIITRIRDVLGVHELSTDIASVRFSVVPGRFTISLLNEAGERADMSGNLASAIAGLEIALERDYPTKTATFTFDASEFRAVAAPSSLPQNGAGLEAVLGGLSDVLAGVPPSRAVLVKGLLAFFNGARPEHDNDESRAVVAALDAVERMGDAERRYYSQNTPNVSSAQALKTELATCNDMKVTEGTTWSSFVERFKQGATNRGFSVSRAEQEALPQARRTSMSDLRAQLRITKR